MSEKSVAAEPDAPEVVVRMAHARALGYCAAGVRAWCSAHDIDYLVFAVEGVPLSRAQAIDDELARRVVAIAVAEATGVGA